MLPPTPAPPHHTHPWACFGAVYEVLLREHTLCAAKVLEWAGRDHLQSMFVHEASMMRRLSHPNLVQAGRGLGAAAAPRVVPAKKFRWA